LVDVLYHLYDVAEYVGKRYNQTNAFKNAISQAKDVAVNLPGGELTIEQQDAVIRLLERLRERKRCVYLFCCGITSDIDRTQLAEFASKNVVAKPSAAQFKMEIDSVASTPASS
jgi:hypothetical protein